MGAIQSMLMEEYCIDQDQSYKLFRKAMRSEQKTKSLKKTLLAAMEAENYCTYDWGIADEDPGDVLYKKLRECGYWLATCYTLYENALAAELDYKINHTKYLLRSQLPQVIAEITQSYHEEYTHMPVEYESLW